MFCNVLYIISFICAYTFYSNMVPLTYKSHKVMHESETIEIVRKKVVETCIEQKQNPKNELKTNETNRNETETG
jgi:hypothetical protein